MDREETEAESLSPVACVVKICSGASGRNLGSTAPSMQSECVSVVCIMFHLRFMTPLTYPKVNLTLSRSEINAARSESAYPFGWRSCVACATMSGGVWLLRRRLVRLSRAVHPDQLIPLHKRSSLWRSAAAALQIELRALVCARRARATGASGASADSHLHACHSFPRPTSSPAESRSH